MKIVSLLKHAAGKHLILPKELDFLIEQHPVLYGNPKIRHEGSIRELFLRNLIFTQTSDVRRNISHRLGMAPAPAYASSDGGTLRGWGNLQYKCKSIQNEDKAVQKTTSWYFAGAHWTELKMFQMNGNSSISSFITDRTLNSMMGGLTPQSTRETSGTD